MNKKIAIYPGTFDPVTLGHLDIIKRSADIVDKLIIGVAKETGKDSLFTLEERVSLITSEVNDLKLGIEFEVVPFEGLLINFALEKNASMIIRGMRAVSDFEYEFKMCVMNRRLNKEIDTVFLMASENHQFISSRFVKEICRLNGDISSFVTENIKKSLISKFLS